MYVTVFFNLAHHQHGLAAMGDVIFERCVPGAVHVGAQCVLQGTVGRTHLPRFSKNVSHNLKDCVVLPMAAP